ncbi:MAG TPA: sugar ABC transporter ATP-binding protein [Polyangiaceae bacterium]|nr:sugar ABC transporter ATP-binding protein [Polyangiaceae bacterium]
MSGASAAPRLELVQVSKTFAGTRALDTVSFDVLPGEVHVVAGENGAGKSTLIRVIAGAVTDYAGELRLDGRRVRFASPADASAHGVATIHQELSLVPSLSIADNFELRRAAPAFERRVRGAARERAARALERLELRFDPATPVEALSVAERQSVEIARALAGDVRVLVMDEPTSALFEPDVERLLSLVERLKQRGIGIVYISHRLDEIFRIADRISVLRDGRRVFTRPAREVTRDELVDAMVGGRAPTAKSERERVFPGLRLGVRGLASEPSVPAPFHALDFELGAGERVGVAGVEGSGASTLLRALFGDVPWASGAVTLEGTPYAPKSPRAAFERGVALLASDRRASVFAELSVLANATLSSLGSLSRAGVVNRRAERAAVARETSRVRLKAPSLDADAGALSGGNQQKVALLRCLLCGPRLLLLDDPTRGIDVGARADVHELLRELAATGTSILFRSTDLAELFALADRVLVLARGRHVATLARAELDEARLLAAMMGGAA